MPYRQCNKTILQCQCKEWCAFVSGEELCLCANGRNRAPVSVGVPLYQMVPVILLLWASASFTHCHFAYSCFLATAWYEKTLHACFVLLPQLKLQICCHSCRWCSSSGTGEAVGRWGQYLGNLRNMKALCNSPICSPKTPVKLLMLPRHFLQLWDRS